MNHVRKLSIRDRSLNVKRWSKQHVNDAPPKPSSSSHLLIAQHGAQIRTQMRREQEKKVCSLKT